MKTIILATLIIFNTALKADDLLKNNFCVAIPTSKKYINPNFEDKYPKTITFECAYTCKSQDQTEKVIATSTITSNNLADDALNVVCQGVKIKTVSWGYDLDRVEPFYAYDTRLIKINEWAFNHIDKNNKDEQLLLLKLKKEIEKVVVSFETTKAPIFLEAATRLRSISNELPSKTHTLDLEIKEIIVNRGLIDNAFTSHSLVQKMLINLAYFKIPFYQF